MLNHPMYLRLDLITAPRAGEYTLFWEQVSYPVHIAPERDYTFSTQLRDLPNVLAGQRRESKTGGSVDLLRDIGIQLWHLLLPDTAPKNDSDALSQALCHGSTTVLLTMPDVLQELPWELLYDPSMTDEQGFLSLRRPLLRFTTTETPQPPLSLPLRILVLLCSPLSLGEEARVDVESERAAIEEATYDARAAGFLHVLIEDFVTLERVRHALSTFRPHVVHYIGHGGYDDENGGVLLWEDERGNEQVVPASRLAQLFGPSHLFAVILHACETGRRNARKSVSGVAGALLRAGIPTVLAQQANFTYESSQQASRVWYSTLTAGRSIPDALFEMRRALSFAEQPDWAVPVLYSNETGLGALVAQTASPAAPDPNLLTIEAHAVDVPTPSSVFVGRHQEMRALRLMLESRPGSGPTMALITGPGGIGKSTLAAQAAIRYGKGYKATVTLSCQSYQGVDIFLNRIALVLATESPLLLQEILPDPKLSIETKIEATVRLLNQGGPLLLIIDNLESIQGEDRRIEDAHLLFLLQHLLTNVRRGRVLLTGRYTIEGLLPHGKFAVNLRTLSLDDLSRYETSQLIQRFPSLAELGETARRILQQEFGGLPYVYDLLSSSAADANLEDLIVDIQGRMTVERQQRSEAEWQKTRHRAIEFAALQAAVARLPALSRTLLARLSILERPVPVIALEQGFQVEHSVWQPLLDWSLLRYDIHKHTYRLHSLTKRYVNEYLIEQVVRQQTQMQMAQWYENYADTASHDLTDYLEAHRLLRAGRAYQQAGKLILQLAEPLRRAGFYILLRSLCLTLITDVKNDDKDLESRAKYELGNLAYLQGDYEQARSLYQQSLLIQEQLGDLSGKASSLHQLGILAQNQGDYDQARSLYQQSLLIKEQLGNLSGKASSLGQLGILAQNQGDYDQARSLYQQSLQTFEQLGNLSGKASSLGQLGILAQNQGDYDQARSLYQQSLLIQEQLGDLSGKATSLHQLGILAQRQGDYDQARSLYQQSLLIKEQLGNLSGKASSLHQLGILAQRQGDYEQARSLYQQSLLIQEQLGDLSGKASSLHQLGNLAYLQGDYEQARSLYQQSLLIQEQLGDLSGKASSLHQLGILAQNQGDYEQARSLYQQSLLIQEQLGNLSGKATSLGRLGLLAQQEGETEQALVFTIQAFLLFQTLRSPMHQQALRVLQRLVQQLDEATFLRYWQSLAGNLPVPDLASTETAPSFVNLLIEFMQMSTWEKSRQFLHAHLELLTLDTDEALTSLLDQQEHEEARAIIQEHRQLLKRCREVGIDPAFDERSSSSPALKNAHSTLNNLCIQVVTVLRTGDEEQKEGLAQQIEQTNDENISLMNGGQALLDVFVAWLRNMDTLVIQQQVSVLPKPLQQVYQHMVVDTQAQEMPPQETDDDVSEGEQVTLEKLPQVVASIRVHGSQEQRQQLASVLVTAEQELPAEQEELRTFLHCLVAVLSGETPDVSLLQPPFLELWQEFEATRQAEEHKQEGSNE